MKKLTLLLAAIALVMLSCTKKAATKTNDVTPPVITLGISATIDGTNETFNTIDSAGYNNTSTYYSLSIAATSSAADTADYLQLALFNKTAIDTGTYIVGPGTYNPPYGPLIVYKLKSSTNFANDYVIDYTGAHTIQLHITAISKTNIQGTFSGTLVVAAGTWGATKTITNGKFNVNVSQ